MTLDELNPRFTSTDIPLHFTKPTLSTVSLPIAAQYTIPVYVDEAFTTTKRYVVPACTCTLVIVGTVSASTSAIPIVMEPAVVRSDGRQSLLGKNKALELVTSGQLLVLHCAHRVPFMETHGTPLHIVVVFV